MGYDISPELVKRVEPFLNKITQLEQERLATSRAQGLPVNDLANHLYQTYLETPEQIKDLLSGKGLGEIPGFVKRRSIPDYLTAEGIVDKNGKQILTPRYTTFGQHEAGAEYELQKAIANKKLAEQLVTSGDILPANEAPRGWKAVQSDNFPRAKGNEPYYASPKVAEYINNVFGGVPQSPVQAVGKFAAQVSGKLQRILLSTPGLSVHGFSIANSLKDVVMGMGDTLTGHPIRGIRTAGSGLSAMARAFVPGAAEDFERTHEEGIRQYASQGLGYRGVMDFRKLQGNEALGKLDVRNLKKIPNTVEDVLVGSPTFKKFI